MSEILGTRVDPTNYDEATARIIEWARGRQSRAVYIANTHVLMEAYDHPDFRGLLNDGDLVTPDGMPLAWVLRLKGHALRDRVYGPTLMKCVIAQAAREQLAVGLFGSTRAVLERLRTRLGVEYPSLSIAYSDSPPFWELSVDEEDAICRGVNESGTRILFVGLGCPKQELWIARQKGKINAVMLGVGAAFDFIAGTKRQAPAWMQDRGMEWLFRLVQEPRRLWRRYLWNNPRFAILSSAELLGIWKP